jgi:non-specific serine/threonine protein kinase
MCLLLLDNCEHVLSACAELADRLPRACPRLRILVTSRERLVAQLAQVEAVQLFVERVRGVLPGFTLTAQHEQAVG